MEGRRNIFYLKVDLDSYSQIWGFPSSSAGKESACNAGDPVSILGLGRSPGEGIGFPLRFSWWLRW